MALMMILPRDITETSLEIQRYHRLAIINMPERLLSDRNGYKDSISAFAFTLASGAACVYARPSSRNSLPRLQKTR